MPATSHIAQIAMIIAVRTAILAAASVAVSRVMWPLAKTAAMATQAFGLAMPRKVPPATDNVLSDAGVTREQVIKVNVYLADLADWPALNGPYSEFFGSSLPARTAFATSALPFGARVEIEAWAVVEETR